MGEGSSRHGVQKAKVKLSSVLPIEQLLKIYKNNYPERWPKFWENLSYATSKD
ncbi:MAG: hypothetical protein O4861_15835 [Trichodesmium sp. St16_bin4-tuft]|nr:hypothetical protein [Trichodesmium sp. St4_bin8_1]MDE5072019.1 hypothetical protein [Trichodesmium sp. St5_bin8]MDE5079537.1 hypothetical protein [Trichodesmium sp. St2_bin6]MDE5091263.1 hypothetical protein [Trichodesmium sp. St18_bin3_1_1]MDE5099721.1 hypothetical protein [Trichodesmium sp. St16_bin4-tuft]MDE5105282.1 hypothetical protein [Trichodesmium sp. St19_bin2]